MSDIKINEQTYSGVNTIVVKTPTGGTTKFTEGERPAGTINITENKTYDVTNYASANVNVPTGGGTSVDLTERLEKEIWESIWEAKNFTTDDGTTYENIKIVFSDYGYNTEDNHIKQAYVYLDGLKKTLAYKIENTTIYFRQNPSGDIISSLNYSISTGNLIADDSKPNFIRVQITLEAILGRWAYASNVNLYYIFKEDYTVDVFNYVTGNIIETNSFYIDGLFIGIDHNNDGNFSRYRYVYERGGFIGNGVDSESHFYYRIYPDGTLDIRQEGIYNIASYANVNVSIDLSTILNTEV